jgi:hypothetical protein
VTPIPGDSSADLGRHRGSHRRRVVVAVLVVVAVAVVAVVMTDPFHGASAAKATVADNSDPTSRATVTRQDLSSVTEVAATLGFAASETVINQARGTVTMLPTVGHVVHQGQPLYQVNGAPVVLLYGHTPAYRTLSEELTGADVTELNADLVDLGDATNAEIPSGTDTFTYSTELGVEKLQADLGVTQTGSLSLGQAVFLPSAARIATISATLGGPAQPDQSLLTVTSTSRQVSIALDADQQTEVAIGDKVGITLPNNENTPGVISSVGAVASAGHNGGSPTVAVNVTPTRPAATGAWDQAPVNVTITTGKVRDATVVPVDALLAQTNGGYAVEVVTDSGRHQLFTVMLGLFDDADGLVQVTDTSLRAGQKIVVPNG